MLNGGPILGKGAETPGALSAPVSRYWMLRQMETFDDGNSSPALSGLEFRATIGGARLTGTVTASSVDGVNVISNAFNDDTVDSIWSSLVNNDRRPWIHLDLGAGNDSKIEEIMFRCRNDGWSFTTPKSFDLLYSNNNTSWQYAGKVIDPAATPVLGEVRTFDISHLR